LKVNSGEKTKSEEEIEAEFTLNEEFKSISQDEEAPVLPREIVKRKLDGEYGSSSGKKDTKGKSSKRLNKTTLKKQRVTQIDASLLKKLEFFKRPKNCVSFSFSSGS